MRRYLILALVILLAACSSDKDAAESSEPVEVLYNKARDTLADRNYKSAVEQFEQVEQQYPYSEWAVRAQIMAAYASYEGGEYEQALGMLERFVKTHPNHASTPYAFYLMGLCYYQQISDVGRDQQMTERAMQALNEVAQRFPNSEYARDARIKMDLVVDHLAGKEMTVGRYYLGRQEYLAAINRFKTVLEKYQSTSHVPEALHRLVECYLKLGVEEEAKKYASVLGHNYPASRWYKDSYALMHGEPPPEEGGISVGRWFKKTFRPNF